MCLFIYCHHSARHKEITGERSFPLLFLYWIVYWKHFAQYIASSLIDERWIFLVSYLFLSLPLPTHNIAEHLLILTKTMHFTWLSEILLPEREKQLRSPGRNSALWSSAWCSLGFSGWLQEGSFPFDVEAVSGGAQLLIVLLNSEGPPGISFRIPFGGVIWGCKLPPSAVSLAKPWMKLLPEPCLPRPVLLRGGVAWKIQSKLSWESGVYVQV